MKQIERIMYMESILDEATEIINDLSDSLEKYQAILPKIKELADYYQNEWRNDFEDDEAGKLPKDLKRGVLSEDAVYNLLALNDEVSEVIEKLNKQKRTITIKSL